MFLHTSLSFDFKADQTKCPFFQRACLIPGLSGLDVPVSKFAKLKSKGVDFDIARNMEHWIGEGFTYLDDSCCVTQVYSVFKQI